VHPKEKGEEEWQKGAPERERRRIRNRILGLFTSILPALCSFWFLYQLGEKDEGGVASFFIVTIICVGIMTVIIHLFSKTGGFIRGFVIGLVIAVVMGIAEGHFQLPDFSFMVLWGILVGIVWLFEILKWFRSE
jgi:FtsH-binding integral membrane protein